MFEAPDQIQLTGLKCFGKGWTEVPQISGPDATVDGLVALKDSDPAFVDPRIYTRTGLQKAVSLITYQRH